MSLSVRIQKRLPGFQLKAEFECGTETLALLGGSGSGKTLTLHCIAGLQTPDEGRIVLDGRVLFDSEKRINLPARERNIGLLFQSYALFPNMTVEQNIACGMARIKNKREKAIRLKTWVEKMRLNGLEKRYPHQLSGGQKQRTALARLLSGKPLLLMLDEPFSALDECLKAQMEQEMLEAIGSLQAPALYITHDMREVRRLCDRVCVIDAGRTQEIMTPSELFAHPQSMAGALLSGCENVAQAIATEGGYVYIADWNARLRCNAILPMGLRAVSVHADQIRVCDEESTVACHTLRILEEEGRCMAICRALETGALIRVAWERSLPPPCAVGQEVRLRMLPEALQPLI